jgi:hypothetical protein
VTRITDRPDGRGNPRHQGIVIAARVAQPDERQSVTHDVVGRVLGLAGEHERGIAELK